MKIFSHTIPADKMSIQSGAAFEVKMGIPGYMLLWFTFPASNHRDGRPVTTA
jgi:hypothetical protein